MKHFINLLFKANLIFLLNKILSYRIQIFLPYSKTHPRRWGSVFMCSPFGLWLWHKRGAAAVTKKGAGVLGLSKGGGGMFF